MLGLKLVPTVYLEELKRNQGLKPTERRFKMQNYKCIVKLESDNFAITKLNLNCIC